jgi:hypothetical protein
MLVRPLLISEADSSGVNCVLARGHCCCTLLLAVLPLCCRCGPWGLCCCCWPCLRSALLLQGCLQRPRCTCCCRTT